MINQGRYRNLFVSAILGMLLAAYSSPLDARPRKRPAAAQSVPVAHGKYRGARKSISVVPSRQAIWAVPALEELADAVLASSPYFNVVQTLPGNTAVNAETLAGNAHFTKAQFACQVIVTDVQRTGGAGASFNLGEISGLKAYNIRIGTNRYVWFTSVRVLVYDARTGSLLSDRVGEATVADRGVYVDVGFDKFAGNKLSGWGIGFDRMRRTSLGQAVQQAIGTTLNQLTVDLADYPLEVRVAALDEGSVYLNVGRKSGLVSGDRFEVIRDKKIITDPVTGEVLERVTARIAELEIVQVRENVATAKRVDENPVAELVRGDVARQVMAGSEPK